MGGFASSCSPESDLERGGAGCCACGKDPASNAAPDSEYGAEATLHPDDIKEDVLDSILPPGDLTQHRIERSTTYAIVNDVKEIKEHKVEVQRLATDGELDDESQWLLEEIQHQVDVAYDILTADALMQELLAKLKGQQVWDKIVNSPLYRQLKQRLEYFYLVGNSVGDESDDWFSIYDNAKENQSMHACYDKNDQYTVYYRLQAQIDAPLRDVMAVANEVQLMQNWNKLVEKEPETMGRRTAHYMVLNYQMSALGGMYKVDILSEVRRFSDIDGGFLAEHCRSVDETHPSYRQPAKGYKRPESEVSNVWVACGPDHTMLMQVGKLKLPFQIGRWAASALGSVAGKFVIGGLVQNSLRSSESDSPWQALLKADKLGLYERLRECAESKASMERRPAGDSASSPGGVECTPSAKIDKFDLSRFFAWSSVRTRPNLSRPSSPMSKHSKSTRCPPGVQTPLSSLSSPQPPGSKSPALDGAAVGPGFHLEEPAAAIDAQANESSPVGVSSKQQPPRKRGCFCCARRGVRQTDASF